jgi:signal transduction histidine kinase
MSAVIEVQHLHKSHSRGDGRFGLVAMRQRIEGLAGTLRVESEPGAGTAISACIPAVPAEVRG